MPTIIPFDASDSPYRFGYDLGRFPVIFDVLWNVRDSSWYFDVLDQNENPLLLGTRIVYGVNLFRTGTHAAFRTNVVRAFDTAARDGRSRMPTFDDLGTRVIVVHATVEELVGDGPTPFAGLVDQLGALEG